MILNLLFSLAIIIPDPVRLPVPHMNVSEDTLRYHDGMTLDVIGKYHTENHYGRFPARYETVLRKEVWNLGKNTAGVGIRFRTNARTIAVRWTVLNNANLAHMASTGVRGVDLYAYVGTGWQYVKTGFPKEPTTEAILLAKGDGVEREYLINLPLYDGVTSVSIGVNEAALITPAKDKHLIDKKPIVYYGTSIAQGGCASRPGLAFTNILARKLNQQIINLGFSGNGNIETSVGQAMVEADASLYVVDCNPNTQPEEIYDRTIALVNLLKKDRPSVPVLLVEGFLYDSDYLNPDAGIHDRVKKKNAELKRAFDALKKSGVSGLHYRTNDGLIGSDREGTVDGVHPNDIGMLRIADALYPTVRKLLR